MTPDAKKELAILTVAEQRLAECTELEQVMTIRDEVELIRLYAKKQHLGLTLQNQAARIRIQAERKIGQWLRSMKLRGGSRSSKSHEGTLKLQLAEIGLTRNQSARWQFEASVSNAQFDTYCKESDDSRQEVTSCGFRRFIRIADGSREPSKKKTKHKMRIHDDGVQPSPPQQPASSFMEAVAEIREHIGSVHRMFAAICERIPGELETVELREIPRYLREVLLLLESLPQFGTPTDRNADGNSVSWLLPCPEDR